MPKYNLLYIDEEDIKRREFLRDTEEDFEVEAMHPLQDFTEMVDYILQSKIDALVVDYKLGETDRMIPYKGTDVVKEIHLMRPNFPCFIFTNWDNDAIVESEDVNYVYPKDLMTVKQGKTTFNGRINTQIKNYKEKISDSEQELLTLIEKGKASKLNIDEENRIVELDNLLNEHLNKKIDIPQNFKNPKQLEKLEELLNVSEELLKKVETKLKVKK